MAGKIDRRFAEELAGLVRERRGTPRRGLAPPTRTPPRGDGGRLYEGFLDSDLAAALVGSEYRDGYKIAHATRLVRDPFHPPEGDTPGWLQSAPSVPLVNRDTTLSGQAGDYVIWARINGENRVLWLKCSPRNEVQRISIVGTPTGGTFLLRFESETTSPIPHNASATAVRSALVALANIGDGNVLVTGGPLPGGQIDVEFAVDLANKNVSLLAADWAGLTGGSAPFVKIEPVTEGCCG